MALSRNRKMKAALPRKRPPRRHSGTGRWFEFLVFLFTAGVIFLMGTLMDSSWTGKSGRLLGNYLRTTWGGALIVPLAFLFYLCVAWIAKIRIPRPLGQIFGTLQLYLSTAFALGLFKQAHWELAPAIFTPGVTGDGLARFFVLNLGALGTVIVAFASLALSMIFFGFRLPARLFRSGAGRSREDSRDLKYEGSKRETPKRESEAPAFTIRHFPRVAAEDLVLPTAPEEPRNEVLASTPVDGLVMVGEELVDPTTWRPTEPIVPESMKAGESPAEPSPEPPAGAPVVPEAKEDAEIRPSETTSEPPVFDGPVFDGDKKAENATKLSLPEEGPAAPPQTASEILEGLLASLEAEHLWEKQEEGTTPTEAATREYVEPLLSKSELDPAQIIEVEGVPKIAPGEQVQELRALLTSPATEESRKEIITEGIKTEGIKTEEAKILEDGTSTAVQEAYPEVQLPEEEDAARVRAGLFPPPLDIFGPPAKEGEDNEGDDLAREQAETIVTTLQNFGVKASVAHIVVGPSVIQFQLELAPGIKVSKVAGLANDLMMALAVVSVRVEAPILGQRYVGIEIPNPRRRGITLRSILESEEFRESEARLILPMGVRVDSKHLICALEDMPHLLVAGTTGSGKSVFTNTCILGMCSQRSPEELRLILVDPKYVEFAIYEGLPHLLARPVTDPKKAISALSWAVQEMENRSECFARAKVRNLASYNEKALPKHRFPHIVVVVDEFADLMYTAGKEVEGLIARLAQKARAAGIHLILATQRPSVDVITGLIKANVPARVAFAVPSQTDSRTIIDTGGAEKLLGRGDMLFYSTRYPRPLRLQASFITEERTLAFVEYMKNLFGEPEYIEFEDYVAGGGGGGENGTRSGSAIIDDPKLEEAVRVVMDTGIASASGLQRYLNVGYPRAGRLVTGLEQLGIVGPQPANSSKPREILMDEESAYETLERARNGDPFGE